MKKGLSVKKILVMAVAVAMVACVSIVGTLAWLTATTSEVKNTFTVGNINIKLEEDAGKDASYQFKMVPGQTITKDPKVTVKAGSEDCWLFVKVTASENLDTYISYTIAADWTAVPNTTDVYYYTGSAAKGTAIPVLANNQVTVKDSVTKGNMDALEASGATLPSLTFKAYAIQKASFSTAAAAWAEVSK